MNIKSAKKAWLLICLGAIIETILLAARMLNPALKREALFYIENYSGLYFILIGSAMIGMALFGYAVFIVIEYIIKRKARAR